MKTIGITGGTGFIGRALARSLLAAGYNVRIFTRRPPQNKLHGADYAIIDYDNPFMLGNAVSGCGAVIHLAAALFCRSKEEFEKANALGTKNLVDAVNALDPAPEKFIYISSLAAGGPSPSAAAPRTENIAEAPVSYYGMTKLEGEKEVKKLKSSVKHVILRPPIVYGKHDSGVSKIAGWVRKGFMVNAGLKNNHFSFIYLDDLVKAIIMALEKDELAGKIYYVCENKSYAWTDFIKLMAKAMGVKMPVMLDLPPGLLYGLGFIYEIVSSLIGQEPVFNRDKAREGAVGNWTASPARWENDVNWPGWTRLEDGLEKTFQKEV